MRITKARDIAIGIEQGRPGIFDREQIREAFWRLDRGMPRGTNEVRKRDRQLAKVIWDHVKTWN